MLSAKIPNYPGNTFITYQNENTKTLLLTRTFSEMHKPASGTKTISIHMRMNRILMLVYGGIMQDKKLCWQ